MSFEGKMNFFRTNQSEVAGLLLPLSMNSLCSLLTCSWYCLLLLFLALLPQLTYGKVELERLEIEHVSQYVDDCSALNSAICVSGLSYLEATDEIVLSLVMNNSLMDQANRDPRINLRVAMLLHLLAFNSAVAREQGIVDEFVDLGVSKHGQDKVIVVGEIHTDESKYIGYYKRDFGSGHLVYDIEISDKEPINFYMGSNVKESY
ncbi:TPA: hypothetical protein ACN36G_004392 [Vibrio parahaemolyticus]|nr:hypothetical protein [Vibrio parahaemolyticus]HCM0804251.1 hypothetical protein [Vibrio parahaemolyticus]